MQAIRARVVGGRLRVDEPTDLPEGSEVDLTLASAPETAEERQQNEAALDEALDDLAAGDAGVDAFGFLAEL